MKAKQIIWNLYSADVEKFSQKAEEHLLRKVCEYPKRLLYVGRFVEAKGIRVLVESFQRANQACGGHWELLMIGNGPLKETIPQTSQIRHLDFVQPDELPSYYHNSGAFCLPSLHENWGVVLHEAAAAGLPLIASDACESAKVFLHHQQNGYLFESNDRKSLSKALQDIMSANPDQLMDMGRKSWKYAQEITTKKWVEELSKVAINPSESA